MKRVTGIGGIFFKAKDAPSLQAWYKRHLGIDVQVWGGAAFDWTDAEGKPGCRRQSCLLFSTRPITSNHVAPDDRYIQGITVVVGADYRVHWRRGHLLHRGRTTTRGRQ